MRMARMIVAVLVASAFVSGCSGHKTPSDAGPGALTSSCLPYTPARTVAELNSVSGYRNVSAFQGGDVGADVLLQDGRRLWVFGDTLRSRPDGTRGFVRNSMLVFSVGCAGVVAPANGGAVIPDRPDGVGYWPMSIAKVRRGNEDLVGVMSQRVKSDDAGGFLNYGSSLAVFHVARGRTPVLKRVIDVGPDQANRRRASYGAASWVDRDGWVYLYGTANPQTKLVFGWSLSVARVRPDQVVNPASWRYWDGRDWVASPTAAATLIPAVGGVSQTLSVYREGNTWYAVSKRDEYLGHDLVVWSAPSPTGPFTAHAPLANIPSNLGGHLLKYMPLAHPDLLPEPGTVVVSISQGSDDPAVLAANPTLYRPRFRRVTLP